MKKLITLAEIRDVKNLAAQANKNAINPLIEDAQIKDLKPLIGSEIYIELLNDTTGALVADLWNGGIYTDNAGRKKEHSGLKRVLIEFVWTRYLFESSDTSTPFGMINKDFKDGQKIDRAREKELRTERQKVATLLWYDTKRFIFNNEDLKEIFTGTEQRNKTFNFHNSKRDPWL